MERDCWKNFEDYLKIQDLLLLDHEIDSEEGEEQMMISLQAPSHTKLILIGLICGLYIF